MSEICVASHHNSIAALLADAEFLALARRDGFLIELRMDYYSDLDIPNLDKALAVFAPNVIATFRHPLEGGKNAAAADADRLKYLQHACEHGVKYVDIEARTPRPQFRKNGAKLILSYHDFQGLPAPQEGLLRLVTSMFDHPEIDICKIACFPKTVDDSLPLLKLLIGIREARIPAIVLAMGEAGFWTRVVGPMFGAPLTYSRGEGAPGTAPGQPTWRDLEEIYRYRHIQPDWPVYGVIGNPIAHSLSPLLHNTALKELNLPGVYLPFKVEGDPVRFVESFAPLNLRGISVTIPHKEAVMKACTSIDPLTKSIGVANTLVWRDGHWVGMNTDAVAAAESLEQLAGNLKDKKVVILGAGGAARGVGFGIKERGAKLFVLNRTREKGEALALALGGKAIDLNEFRALNADIIVNTTPLGMHPNVDQAPLDKEDIPQGSIVFDTVYNPLRTRLLKLAEERGCRTLEGAAMFVGQGIRQFELFTGVQPPKAAVESAVLNALKQRQSRQR